MPDYSKGKIYAIRAPGTDDVYIGSTTLSLSQRMAEHRRNYSRWTNGKTNYTSSFEILGWPGCYIELIEEVSCQSRDQLNKREGEVFRNTPNAINYSVPGRTTAQWKKDNRERVNEKQREYDAKRRNKIPE